MAKAYQYDAAGYFAGEAEDYGLLPNNATYTAPQKQDGYIPRWTGDLWELVENHKGAAGYLDGKPHTIKDYGPLPDGWSETPPPPTADELAAARARELQSALDEIDRRSARAMRALLAGTATDDDQRTLVELERQAGGLRAELQATGL